MAAGRCDVLRRREDYYYFKKEYDCCRGHDRGVKLGRGHDQGVGFRNGYNWRSSSEHRRGELDGRIEEREPGEVLSGNRSDDAVAYELGSRDGETLKLENGEQLTRDKKRKFSPIVWDREETEVRISSKNRIVDTSTRPSCLVPLPKSCSPVPNASSDAGVRVYPIAANHLQGLQTLSVETHVAQGSVGSRLSEPQDSVLLSFLSQDQESCGNKEQELEQVEDEDFVIARNISTSRWASEDEDLSEKREMVRHLGPSSPECGEFRREGPEGDRGRSSGSVDGSCLLGPASGDECSEYNSDNNDFMEIDEGSDDSVGIKQLDSNSDDDDDGVQGIQEPIVSMQRSINMLQSCRSVLEYEKLNKINEGTYGVVYRARDKKTGEIMALKKVKMGRETEREGFPLTALREINILSSFDHPSIVGVKEVVTDDFDGVFMVMEYMEHDLKGVMEKMKQPFSTSEVKCLMLQLLEGVKYLHDNWVIHRDLKTSNLLLNNRGELKVCDFGLSRQYGSPLKPYTPLVVTLWYRAPELLLGRKQYSTAVDMWSVGCIMAELLAKEPLFKGETEVDQLRMIFKTLGSPNETIWPGFSELPGAKANFVKQPYNMLRKRFPATSFTGSPVLSDLGFDLLNKLLTYDPDKRITAEAALSHGWFREVPLPKSKDFLPTFPAHHAQDRHLQRLVKSPDPLKGQRRKELLEQGLLVGTDILFG